MEAQATVLLGINRFTALVYTHYHKEWWANSSRRIIIFVVVPGVIMGIVVNFTDVYFMKVVDNGLVPKMESDLLPHIGFGIAGFFSILYCFVLVFTYIYIWYTIRQHRQVNLVIISSNHLVGRGVIQKRREIKLLALSALICATQIIVTTFLLLKFVLRNIDSDLSIYNCISTMYSSVNPYFIILFSDAIRKNISRYLFQQTPKKIVSTPQNSTALTANFKGGNVYFVKL
ncbi:unnamed protein product [Bursaphelenchus okinawaensis]|uniref:Serpentine receptor class gamma n=1 Tax=Bursaphelenchus okinawaensis TaxID=465554 RepID=A0A811KZF4_9BILA|nr:unnamed protein product [Bursaphelenchus okinawaensis]CAG9114292.1 unnamed protein product [Bursaphelenchus okinawaensis]